ncbi:MAG: hypothetical protein R3D67_11235 [Hyphomicrobiaceae bacterium]
MPTTTPVSLPASVAASPITHKDRQNSRSNSLGSYPRSSSSTNCWANGTVSWENLEASGDKAGRLKLVARDNGGASPDDWEGYDAYGQWVSRYDKDLIAKLTTLNDFLNRKGPAFAGFTSPESWKTAVGFINPQSYATFRKKLAQLVEKRVPAPVKQYGDKHSSRPRAPKSQPWIKPTPARMTEPARALGLPRHSETQHQPVASPNVPERGPYRR